MEVSVPRTLEREGQTKDFQEESGRRGRWLL